MRVENTHRNLNFEDDLQPGQVKIENKDVYFQLKNDLVEY